MRPTPTCPTACGPDWAGRPQDFIAPIPGTDKFHVDLKGANARWLERAGLDPAHIALCPACTACRLDRFWSHRIQGTRRGSMAAMIQLAET